MKITIDTKEESVEDLRKLIRMLQGLVGEASSEGGEAEFQPEEDTATAFGAMFGDEPKKEEDDDNDRFEVETY